jgi:hypothetical protein
LLGAIAPDVRAVSGQTREETHFFAIPPDETLSAQEVMFRTWPELHRRNDSRESRAAFIAGYLSHLIMDQVWLKMIVMPHLFLNGFEWGTRHPRWRLYSILMTYLEYRAASRLEAETTDVLERAAPDHWLPFVTDQHLATWRDHVVRMMRGDGPRRTSELFARSNGMTTNALEAIVLSEERMAAEAYPVVSPDRLRHFEDETSQLTCDAVASYLSEEL